MRRLKIIVVMLVVLIAVNVSAGGFRTYYSDSDFLLTSPGAMKFGMYGYHNPALLSYLHQPDIVVSWAGEEDRWEKMDFDKWGISFAAPNLGFGFIHEKVAGKSVTDYRISLAGGNKNYSTGFGYGWSKGDTDYFDRESVFYAGSLARPNRYLSVGLTGAISTDGERKEGVVDVAVRPFGDETIALFGDYALQDYQTLEEGNWSAGVSIEPLPGVRVTGRYFDTEAFTVGFQKSFGNMGVTTQSMFDEEQEYSHNSYSIRVGAYDRNLCKSVMKDEKYLKLDLNGELQYQRFGLFDDSNTLSGVLSAIEAAKEDSKVKGIAINTSGMRISSENLWEIREGLEEFKAAGKQVILYFDHMRITEYYFATVADKIVMDPYGSLIIKGFVYGRTYYKGMLEKLGIGFDEWRLYKYKSAVESFSREGMSEGEAEQWNKILDDMYRFYGDGISQARGLTRDEFDVIVNEEVIFRAEQAKEEKLVDVIGRWDKVEELVEEDVDHKEFVSQCELEKFNLPKDDYWSEKPTIAVVYVQGVCAMDEGIEARNLVKVLEGVKDNDAIEAVVLRVDSPGGDALASDVIAEEILEIKDKKPVIVSQGYVAASGGYWISMYGDEILAAPNTFTGSIGVIGAWVYDDGLKESMGMTTDVIKRGEHSDFDFIFRLPLVGIGLPDRPLNEEEREKAINTIRSFYKDFVQKVSKARDMDYDAVHEVAQGRVWTGISGKEVGLIDELGGLARAVEIAKEKAEIGEEYQIVEMPEKELLDLSMFRPKLLGMEMKDDKMLNYLKLRIEHNGEPMPILPMEALERIEQQ